MSRAATVLVDSRRRSARVDLPWSMCAIIEKLRIVEVGGVRWGVLEKREEVGPP